MIANWVKETTTTTGTGTLTLSAITGFPRFSEVFVTGQLVSYAILTNDVPPQPLEWGIGTYTATNTLVRSKVLGVYTAGNFNTTNPTAVSLSAGTYNVICTNNMGNSVPGLLAVDTTNGSGGAFVPYPWQTTTSAGTLVLTADRLYLLNFRMATPCKLTAVKMRVSAGVTGNCRMGIWKANSDGTPGALMFTSGDISTTTSSVVITWTLTTAQILAPGWYYFGLAAKGIAPTFNAFANVTTTFPAETLVGVDATAVQTVIYKYVTLSGGWTTLPDPPSSTQTAVAASPPAFAFVLG